MGDPCGRACIEVAARRFAHELAQDNSIQRRMAFGLESVSREVAHPLLRLGDARYADV
jgi:hypothetical protein